LQINDPIQFEYVLALVQIWCSTAVQGAAQEIE